MAAAPSPPEALPFTPPAIPWLAPRALEPVLYLVPGLDPERRAATLARLCAETDVQAVLAFGSRARHGRRGWIPTWIWR